MYVLYISLSDWLRVSGAMRAPGRLRLLVLRPVTALLLKAPRINYILAEVLASRSQ